MENIHVEEKTVEDLAFFLKKLAVFIAVKNNDHAELGKLLNKQKAEDADKGEALDDYATNAILLIGRKGYDVVISEELAVQGEEIFKSFRKRVVKNKATLYEIGCEKINAMLMHTAPIVGDKSFEEEHKDLYLSVEALHGRLCKAYGKACATKKK